MSVCRSVKKRLRSNNQRTIKLTNIFEYFSIKEPLHTVLNGALFRKRIQPELIRPWCACFYQELLTFLFCNRNNFIPYRTISYHTGPYYTIQDHIIPYRTILYHTGAYYTGPCRTISVTLIFLLIVKKATNYTLIPSQTLTKLPQHCTPHVYILCGT